MWIWAGYASNPALQDSSEAGTTHTDRFNARQRNRFQIQFIADENLSALLSLENNIVWGSVETEGANGSNLSNAYGAIDADNASFVIRRMHLDWTIPGTQVKTRMGVQGIALPGVAFSNPVLDTDAAGVAVSVDFTPNVGLTAFWVRAYNDADANDDGIAGNLNDEMDVLGLILPVKTDAIRLTPWAMVASIGRDSGYYESRPVPSAYSDRAINTDVMDAIGYAYWGGLSLELPVIDPFFVKLDAMIGGSDTGDSDTDMSGWYVAGDIGYKFSWASISAIGFYSSGDDGDDDYGQIPVVSANGGWNLKSGGLYGLAGESWRRYDGYVTSESAQGIWGLGLKIADFSFVDNLSHTLLGMYYGGTNDREDFGRRTVGTTGVRPTGVRAIGRSLDKDDNAWELTLINIYKVNENLSLRMDVGYIQLDLGDDAWTNEDDTKGNFITGVGVQYQF